MIINIDVFVGRSLFCNIGYLILPFLTSVSFLGTEPSRGRGAPAREQCEVKLMIGSYYLTCIYYDFDRFL